MNVQEQTQNVGVPMEGTDPGQTSIGQYSVYGIGALFCFTIRPIIYLYKNCVVSLSILTSDVKPLRLKKHQFHIKY